MPVEPAADSPLVLAGPRSRYLLPYERRLSAWQVRRWQAAGKHRYDVAAMELNSGPEFVRLFAAHCAGRKLMSLTGFLVPVVVIGYAALVSDGWGCVLAGAGVLAASSGIGVIGLVRMFQSDNARKEYRRAKGLADN